MRELMLRCGREALEAGRLEGLPALPIFGLSPDDVAGSDDLVKTLLDTLLGGFVLPSTRTTILQDWLKGRRSEVADINGRVVRTLAGHGVPAPANAAVVEMARRIEAHEIEPGVDNLQQLLALAEPRPVH